MHPPFTNMSAITAKYEAGGSGETDHLGPVSITLQRSLRLCFRADQWAVKKNMNNPCTYSSMIPPIIPISWQLYTRYRTTCASEDFIL